MAEHPLGPFDAADVVRVREAAERFCAAPHLLDAKRAGAVYELLGMACDKIEELRAELKAVKANLAQTQRERDAAARVIVAARAAYDASHFTRIREVLGG